MSQHRLLIDERRNTPTIPNILMRTEREKKKKHEKGIMQITCVATATDSSRGHFMSLTSWDKDECVCQIVR